MRICIIYDCLYPYTVGGAERWYRNVAERLVEQGHEVTYLTMRQWGDREVPQLAGVDVHAVTPRMPLYVRGRRRILPPVVFGVAVCWHLLRHGRRYDVVHTASFPYFSLLAAGLARPLGRFRVAVDWHEVWTRAYWAEYLGDLGGAIGWSIQRRCLRVRQRAFCFSRLHEARLHELDVNGTVTLLKGQFEGEASEPPQQSEPLVVFAGRHIPEKRPESVVHGIAEARKTIPDLRGVIFGDGPERPRVRAAIENVGLGGVIETPGFVEGDVVESALSRAMCLVLPSRREGYGLVVLEAISRGTPAIVVAGEDNAAAELVEDKVNGFVAQDAGAAELSGAIVAAWRGGDELRRSTFLWFGAHSHELSLDSSVAALAAAYRD